MTETIIYFSIAAVLLVLQYSFGGGRRWGAKEWTIWTVSSISWPVYIIAIPWALFLWAKEE
jgi:hypothetical protein